VNYENGRKFVDENDNEIEIEIINAVSTVFSYSKEKLCNSFCMYESKPNFIPAEVSWGVLKYYQEKNKFYEVLNILEDRFHVNILDEKIDGQTLGSFVKDIKEYVKRIN